jgi:hypothetical protein
MCRQGNLPRCSVWPASTYTCAWFQLRRHVAQKTRRACAENCRLVSKSAEPYAQVLQTQASSICGQTQIDSPDHAHHGTEQHSLIDGDPQEADQADSRPELVPVLHHGPCLVAAVLCNCAPSVLLALLGSIDISHVCQEHECVNYCANGLIQQELDQDIDLADLGLAGRSGLLIGAFLGGGRYVGGKVVLEERLPDDVWWRADNAEHGKLEHWRDGERERRLGSAVISTCSRHSQIAANTHAVVVRSHGLRKYIGRHAEHRALQRLRKHC